MKIVSNETACVSCLLCQMACSYKFTQTFLPSQAMIAIDESDTGVYKITFRDGCDGCGFCVGYCVYGALNI
ncbi:MAG: hypothetical protein SU899_03810, partial [Chloroflexota bacterium]|nr:hypothetical protein [Chloroflexota bacterium]